MGATAAGKSRLALALASHLPIEIVSVDSAQVYRGLDIGTAKPSAAERAAVPHHLIDLRDPSEPYSAADFCTDALKTIDDVLARGRIPLLVGGTMLYFRALRDGLADLPSADATTRAQIANVVRYTGNAGLHAWLANVDPITAARLHVNDPQRIQRALEVFLVSGRPLSQHLQSSPKTLQTQLPCRLVQLAIGPKQRRDLDDVIGRRVLRMLAHGLVEEVRQLKARGDLSPDLPAMRAVGYRQVWEFLEGRIDHEHMVSAIIKATQHLAKRQYTWLRAWSGLQWCNDPSPEEVALFLTR